MNSSTKIASTCQQCQVQLAITLLNSNSTSRLEDSFILLHEATGSGRTCDHEPNRGRMDESFVLLPRRAHTVAPTQRVPFNASFQVATRILEAATTSTDIEQPICLDCANEYHKQLELQINDLQADIATYETALHRLRDEELSEPPPNDAAFAAALLKAEEEEALERNTVKRLESELATALMSLQEAKTRNEELDGLEARHWEEFVAHQIRLNLHLEERDRLTHAIEAANVSLDILKRTNVHSDVFRIWFDGPFGTISGLRLGRTTSHPVEWDEINAAWGQAVLLLASLARSCSCRFTQYTLVPAGSFPKVKDKRGNAYDLFGPVGKVFGSNNYDRAQVGFLACLKEFAHYLKNNPMSSVDSGGRPFELPWPIESDKIGGYSVRLTFAKDKNWTKALKYMLVDLKVCLKAALTLMDWGTASSLMSIQREGPTSVEA